MDQADKTRLQKLIGMLGSAFDNEKAIAARKIGEMAEKYKMTISELIHAGMGPVQQPPPPPPPPPPPQDDGFSHDVSNPLLSGLELVSKKYQHMLTDWERNFAGDVSKRYDADYDLSERQVACAEKIIRKVMARHPI